MSEEPQHTAMPNLVCIHCGRALDLYLQDLSLLSMGVTGSWIHVDTGLVECGPLDNEKPED